MSSHLLRTATLFGVFIAALLSLTACSNLKWEQATPIEDEKGHSGYEGGPRR